MVGEDFLYWPSREDSSWILCSPLWDMSEGYNLELKAAGLYRIRRAQGVEFIEPLPAEDYQEEKDQRLARQFFRREDA